MSGRIVSQQRWTWKFQYIDWWVMSHQVLKAEVTKLLKEGDMLCFMWAIRSPPLWYVPWNGRVCKAAPRCWREQSDEERSTRVQGELTHRNGSWAVAGIKIATPFFQTTLCYPLEMGLCPLERSGWSREDQEFRYWQALVPGWAEGQVISWALYPSRRSNENFVICPKTSIHIPEST